MASFDGSDSKGKNTLANLLREVVEGHETAFHVTDKLVKNEDGMGVEERRLVIERRQLQPEPPPEPIRQETPPRAHTFYDPFQFTRYVSEYGGDALLVLGDPNMGVVKAVLDEAKTDGVEILELRPMIHPLFVEWSELLRKARVGVREFATFCLKHRRVIAEPDALELIQVFSQITGSRMTEVKAGVGNKSINGVMVTTNVQGVKKDAVVEIPDCVTVVVPIYVGTDPVSIGIDLLVDITKDDEVVVNVVSSDLLEAKVTAFDRMMNIISDGVENEDAVVGLGSIGHDDWPYRFPA